MSINSTHNNTCVNKTRAVLVRDDGYSPWVLHRVVRDNLGSIVVVTDSAGFVEQRLSYDAWGALRDPDTGVAYAPGAAPEPMLLGRGFTGHPSLPKKIFLFDSVI